MEGKSYPRASKMLMGGVVLPSSFQHRLEISLFTNIWMSHSETGLGDVPQREKSPLGPGAFRIYTGCQNIYVKDRIFFHFSFTLRQPWVSFKVSGILHRISAETYI